MVRPEFKIILYIFFVALLFSAKNIEFQIALGAIFFIIFIFYPQKPNKNIRSGLIYIIIFLSATFIGNIFNSGGKVVLSIFFINITEYGINFATIKTLQIFSMIVGAKMLILNTTIEDLINGFGSICRPLKIIKLPIDEFIELMHLTVIALNNITGEIKEEARLRSIEKKLSGLTQKIGFIIEIVLPLLIMTIKSPEKLFPEKLFPEKLFIYPISEYKQKGQNV
jgi:energy-coupling factor transport system permease protein